MLRSKQYVHMTRHTACNWMNWTRTPCSFRISHNSFTAFYLAPYHNPVQSQRCLHLTASIISRTWTVVTLNLLTFVETAAPPIAPPNNTLMIALLYTWCTTESHQMNLRENDQHVVFKGKTNTCCCPTELRSDTTTGISPPPTGATSQMQVQVLSLPRKQSCCEEIETTSQHRNKDKCLNSHAPEIVLAHFFAANLPYEMQ